MSAQIYELVSHFDLLSLEDLPKILEWSPKVIEDIHVALWERIYAAQYTELSPGGDVDQFRFLASASIRGDICPGCRKRENRITR
jgi:hypothetical protein